jgi:hypothetical protein
VGHQRTAKPDAVHGTGAAAARRSLLLARSGLRRKRHRSMVSNRALRDTAGPGADACTGDGRRERGHVHRSAAQHPQLPAEPIRSPHVGLASGRVSEELGAGHQQGRHGWRRSWGLLVKDSGSNCNGYSCDILCQGSGSGQVQRDVLLDAEDAQLPIWGDPMSGSDIVVRPCQAP